MTRPLVLDASAAIRLVLSPADHDEWLDLLESSGTTIAPELFAMETANALWKYHQAGKLSQEEITGFHAQALALVTDWQEDKSLFPEALLLAAKKRHPVYDCVYLTCCHRFGARLLTHDSRLGKLYDQLR